MGWDNEKPQFAEPTSQTMYEGDYLFITETQTDLLEMGYQTYISQSPHNKRKNV